MIDTENLHSKILAKLINVVANAELETDQIRVQISKTPDFNIKSAFSYIDRQNLQRIGKENLKDYLIDEGLDCSNDEVFDLIHAYDSTQTGCLNFQDFSRMLEVKILSIICTKDNSSQDGPEKGARSLLKALFEHEIILLRRADPVFHELRFSDGYDPQFLFFLIANNGSRCFDYGDLDTFMRAHGVQFSDAELVAIFRRADPRNLGVISYLEFKKYLLFHQSSLINTSDDPLTQYFTSKDPPDLEELHTKYNSQNYGSRNQPKSSARTSKKLPEKSTQPLIDSGIERTIKLSNQRQEGFSEFQFGKEMRGAYFRDHFKHFESSKPSDFYYFNHYFPNSTFKHYSHSLREFPKLERDFQQPTRQFYAATKMADVSTMKPLQVTFPQYHYEEKIYNPVRPANLANTRERWKVKKLEDVEVLNPNSVIGKADEYFRKRVAEITVLKPNYIP